MCRPGMSAACPPPTLSFFSDGIRLEVVTLSGESVVINHGTDNWLKPFRGPGGWTQAALAKAIGKSVRQIRRWETEATSADAIPFGRIAAALEVPEQELVTAHCAWLRACAISGIEVNAGRIARALQACACTTLTDDILLNLNVGTVGEAADRLAEHFRDCDLRSIRSCCNQPILSAVDAVLKDSKRAADLETIRSFVGSVALTAVIPDDRLKGPCQLRIYGTKQCWTLRLMLDAALGFPMTQLRVAIEPGTAEKSRIALDSTATKAVQVPGTKAEPGDPWARVRELVTVLAEEAFFKRPCPPLDGDGKHSALRNYCGDLDLLLEQTNEEHHHCFAYTLIEEPEPVRTELLDLLPALRFFICTEGGAAIPVLRLDERGLEAWIANALAAIETAEEQLETQSKTKNGATNVAIGGEKGADQQKGSSPEMAELLRLLRQILEQSDRSLRLPPSGSWPRSWHRLDEPSAHALIAALKTDRPLLVRGEPGVGKSQLARAAAAALGRSFIATVIQPHSEYQELLWIFDHTQRLADAQLAGAMKDRCLVQDTDKEKPGARNLGPGLTLHIDVKDSAANQQNIHVSSFVHLDEPAVQVANPIQFACRQPMRAIANTFP